jgi:hypothetical protein
MSIFYKIKKTMKKSNLLTALFTIVTLIGYAQKKEVRDVATFKKVGFGGAEILEKYETKVEGDKLSIRPKDRWSDWRWGKEDKITAYVTVKEIESVAVMGSGNVIAQTNLVSNVLDLKVSGSGSLKAEVEVSGDLEADVSGSGNIELKGNAEKFDGDISGSGGLEASLAIVGETDISISGSGKIIIDGSAKSLEAKISGSGGVRGDDFKVNTCTIRIAGSGSVEINVQDELDVNINGSGDVAYKGEPKKINNHSSGSGKVRKL